MSEPMQLTLDGEREVPISRTMPRQSDSRMLRRPGASQPHEPGLFLRRLETALDNASVAPGEAFYVSRVPPASPKALAGPGAARRDDPATSKRAAVSPRRGTQRAEILLALQRGGATTDELIERTGIPKCSVTPRVGDLKRDGYIEASGHERPGSMGADQQVVELTAKGIGMCAALRSEDA